MGRTATGVRGVRLGKGESLESILDGMHAVAEGVRTSRAAAGLARRHGVDMPIVEHVVHVVRGDMTPLQMMDSLLSREVKPE